MALIVGLVDTSSVDTLELELRTHIIQFLLIVAPGAVFAIIVEVVKGRLERQASSRQYEVDTVTSLLDRLDSSYRVVKRERRLLRLMPLEESKDDVMQAMSRISADKEDVAKLWREIVVLSNWPPELKPAQWEIKAMEGYLDLLEDEWEKEGPKAEAGFNATTLEELQGFMVRWNDQTSTFGTFREPYYNARERLIRLLAAKRTDVDQKPSSPD